MDKTEAKDSKESKVEEKKELDKPEEKKSSEEKPKVKETPKEPEKPKEVPKPESKPKETGTQPKDVEVNPKLTLIRTEIKFKDVISVLATKFKKVEITKDAPEIKTETNWFQRTDLNPIADLDQGSWHIIDVQPDFRYPTVYIMYSTLKAFSAQKMKPQPYITLLSLTAYQSIQLAAALLIQDLTCRQVMSFHARTYMDDKERNEYYELLLDSAVTDDLRLLIEHIATVIDPRRPGLEFVPSLASLVFNHDYGRLTPASLMLAAHNAVCTRTRTEQVQQVLRRWYDTNIVTVDQQVYKVSHFIGGQYALAAAIGNHNNWIQQAYQLMITPIIGEVLNQKPTLTQIPITEWNLPQGDLNPYDFMLNYAPDSYAHQRAFMLQASSFVKAQLPSTVPLRAILERVGGITPLCHTIEPLVLPTWHHLNVPDAALAANIPQNVNDIDYAQYIHFKVGRQAHAGQLPVPVVPAAQWIRPFYMVEDAQFDPATAPVQYELFSKPRDTEPDVLLMTPFEVNLQRGTIAQTLGFKIISEEFDAAIIPVPNPEISLHTNNSNFYNGSIPIQYVKPVIPVTDPDGAIRIIRRQEYENETYPLGFGYLNSNINVAPVFANNHVQANTNRYHGLVPQNNYDSAETGWTYTAWNVQQQPHIPEQSRIVWSSYRTTEMSNTQHGRTHFYYTLRPFYGVGLPLSKIQHPSKLMKLY